MSYLPARELVEILEPAYHPCPGFSGACRGVARWKPELGHVPRGFVGGLGSVDEIEVVILVAEPGDPLAGEKYSGDHLAQTCQHTLRLLRGDGSLFHRNLRYLLDQLFPGLRLRDQLRKAWITETYLCSAPEETGPVRTIAERECASRYLGQQLELLEGLPVIALGGKAYARVRRVPGIRNVRKAYSVAPPGCNHRPARPSWDAAAKWARSLMEATE